MTTVGINATGGAGGGAHGGQGGQVTGSVGVTHGQTLDICVDLAGGAGGSSGGGAGGGASGVSVGSTFAAPLIVAGGGGGGGGGTVPGSGGPAGQPGTGSGSGSVNGGSPTDAGGPGGGAPGTGTGGGGGDGYVGGGGGSGTGVGGGGGAGGTNLCSANGCNITTSTGSPQVTLTYTVARSPVASIGTPANGGVYALGASITESFTCAEGANGPGVSTCTDQNGHGSGTPLDTSTPGTHTLTVTAASADGLSSSSSSTYTVAAPPRIWLPLPASGQVFTVGQAVDSWYECGDGSGGPGIQSCVDQNGQPSGAAIDTSTAGTHTFTVTATSQDGQTSSVTNTYRVIPVPTVSQIAAHRGGVVTLSLTVYGPGTVDVMSTAGLKAFALAADVVHPPNGSFLFGSAHIVAAGQQTFQVRVGLSQAGKLLLRDHRRASLRVLVVYTAPGGTAQIVKSLALNVSR